PSSWPGTIQATASEATLSAILSAREQVTDFTVNERGLQGHPHLRVYASKQIHSSIEKAVKIAGLGKENFVPIPTDSDYAMDAELLEEAILRDQKEGNIPTCIIVGLGTTGSTAIDPLKKIVALAKEHKIWVHVDAAYAGTAMMLHEHRHMLEGIEQADSFVVNPHKWMMVNFDCSCYFVKDKGALIRTFEILPEYLKTNADQQVNNYRDWGIPLGRRFRALKLWFVMRNFGADHIRRTIRNHITWAQEVAAEIRNHDEFELLAPVPFNLVCFRFAPSGLNLQELNELNKSIVERIKGSGTLYLTHTVLSGKYTIRLVAGQTYMEKEHLKRAWTFIQETAKDVYAETLPS
ncbi:MAG: aminotransferase class I/II-fold pyridoxal phosphate-dependent enzyme, partial [Bacteroidota bacterium]